MTNAIARTDFNATVPRTVGSQLTAGLQAVRRLVAAAGRWNHIRCQRRLLREMPNELLRDIGVDRSDIDGLAEQIVDGRNDPTRRPRGFI
jgi:uncharacterized protein YjiS (DUF1127 family)